MKTVYVGLRQGHSFKPVNEWKDIIRFLEGEECIGIRKKLCVSCGFGKVYDKRGNEFKVTRYFTLDNVKEIVDMIKSQD